MSVERMLRLWKLLDDIDTLDHMANDNDASFRLGVRRVQRKRFEILSGEEFDELSAPRQEDEP